MVPLYRHSAPAPSWGLSRRESYQNQSPTPSYVCTVNLRPFFLTHLASIAVVVPNLDGVWLKGGWNPGFMVRELFGKHHVHRQKDDVRVQLLQLLSSFGDSGSWVDSGLGKHMSELTWWACGPLQTPWWPWDMEKWVALCGEGERGATTTYRFVGRNALAARHIEKTLRAWVPDVRSLCITPKVSLDASTAPKGTEAAYDRAEYRARWRAAIHAKVLRSGNVVSLTFTEKHTEAEKRAMKPYQDWEARGGEVAARLFDAVAAGRLPAARDINIWRYGVPSP